MKLVVLDNVMLKPGHDVYILVNTSITYSVIRLRQGRTTGLFSPLFHSKITQQSPSQKSWKKWENLPSSTPFQTVALSLQWLFSADQCCWGRISNKAYSWSTSRVNGNSKIQNNMTSHVLHIWAFTLCFLRFGEGFWKSKGASESVTDFLKCTDLLMLMP